MKARRAAEAPYCPTPGGLGAASSCRMHRMPGDKQHPHSSNHLHERRLQHGIVKGVTVCRWKSGGLDHCRQAAPQHTAGQSAACSRSHGRQQLRGSLPRRQGAKHASQLPIGCSCFGWRSCGRWGQEWQQWTPAPTAAAPAAAPAAATRLWTGRCCRAVLAHVATDDRRSETLAGARRRSQRAPVRKRVQAAPGAGSEACDRVIGAERVGFRRRGPRCTGSCRRRCRCAGMELRRPARRHTVKLQSQKSPGGVAVC